MRAFKRCIGLACLLALASLVSVAGLIAWSAKQAQDHRLGGQDRPAAAVVFYIPDQAARSGYLQEAAQLYQEGRVRIIVCVGGARPRRDYFGSQEMAAALRQLGVPDDSLRCGDRRSDDSVTNLRVARDQLKDTAFQNSVLVTDALHALRLRYLAGAYLDEVPRWQVSPPEGPWGEQILRGYWELAAWLLELAPQSWRRLAIDASRE